MEMTLGLSFSGWQHAVVLGTWFGLLHAFDADHLATIGGLAVNNRSLSPAGYALRWALGHGAALGVIAVVVLGLDAAGVLQWTSYAELLVCFALLVIGAQALHAVWRRRPGSAWATAERQALATHTLASPHSHLHFMAPFHAHARSRHTSLLMGVIHGGAGSAAVLALLPLAQFQSGVENAVYLACFSAGVGLGALAFAKTFAVVARRSVGAGERLGRLFQAAVGVLALASGALLLIETTYGGG